MRSADNCVLPDSMSGSFFERAVISRMMDDVNALFPHVLFVALFGFVLL